MKSLYTENYGNLMKEIKEDKQKNGKIFHAHGLEEQILLKCQYYPKQSTYSMLSQSQQHQYSLQSWNNPKICMEPEKTPNSQSNPEKENQSWRHHNPGLQDALQSCNHQDSMVLAQKQILRSMEHKRKLRNGPRNVWPTNL